MQGIMDLFYLNIIPIVASFAGPIFVLLRLKNISRAQWLLLITQVAVGVTLILFNVWNSNNRYNSFIYDYLYTVSGVLCPPLYYLFICEYTERKGGLKLKNRRAFIPAIIYLVVLSFCALNLGAEHYETLVSNYQEGFPEWGKYDDPFWNIMIVWNYYGSVVFLVLETIVFVFLGWRKLSRYLTHLKTYKNELTKYAMRFSQFITFFSALAVFIACMVVVVTYSGNHIEWIHPVLVFIVTILQISFSVLVVHLDYDASKMDPIIKKLTYK